MKTELINEICTIMNQHLSVEQNKILERTLHQVLSNFNIPDRVENLSEFGQKHQADQSIYCC